jgi:acyl dehydratase
MAGLWFDELAVGQTFEHAIRRTMTETDNVLFTTMTLNPALRHLAQVGGVNESFMPSVDEIAHAQRVLAQAKAFGA